MGHVDGTLTRGQKGRYREASDAPTQCGEWAELGSDETPD